MKNWLEVVPAAERAAYVRAGFGGDMAIGNKPALVVVDVTYGFTGLPGQSLEEGIAMFGTACGPVSWETIPRIERLIKLFRDKRHPIIFTRGAPDDSRFAGRATKAKERAIAEPALYNEFPEAVMPRPEEWVVQKTKASGFFQTPLATGLLRMGVDCVLVCGVSTSGCVRASVVDSHSYGFRTFVVDDCCFDRSHFAHCANLFDMNAKYATAVSLEEVAALLNA